MSGEPSDNVKELEDDIKKLKKRNKTLEARVEELTDELNEFKLELYNFKHGGIYIVRLPYAAPEGWVVAKIGMCFADSPRVTDHIAMHKNRQTLHTQDQLLGMIANYQAGAEKKILCALGLPIAALKIRQYDETVITIKKPTVPQFKIAFGINGSFGPTEIVAMPRATFDAIHTAYENKTLPATVDDFIDAFELKAAAICQSVRVRLQDITGTSASRLCEEHEEDDDVEVTLIFKKQAKA